MLRKIDLRTGGFVGLLIVVAIFSVIVNGGITLPFATSAPSSAPQTPTPFALTGNGKQATNQFTLEDGLAVFHLTHRGNGDFTVTLLDANGDEVDQLVKSNGPFDGTKAIGIDDAGTYQLDVQAEGQWTIGVDQSVDPQPPALPQTFKGKGQSATPFFAGAGKLATFHLTHDGKGPFSVWLLDDQGSQIDQLANSPGVFDGSKADTLDDGTYLLQVQADGNWTIDVH